MSSIAKPSPWDSDVFRCRVGLLSGNLLPPTSVIATENAGLFDVVFVKFEGWVDPDGPVGVVDYLYDMELLSPGGAWPADDVIVLEASPRHLEIARTAFHDSRFLRDRRLAHKAPDLYDRWVAGKKVHVLRGASDDAFLLETQDGDGAKRIALVAVDEWKRSAGAGKALLAGVLLGVPAATWRVKVSVRNHRAVRFYEGAGFRVRSVWTAFHVWTEGEVV